ncbi:MAG: hypothetical protein DWH91_00480 [Planctomycetota bacterium]|nr:MAG: hypothetical protein DWH91_00480 [Planctomycetota bacterium]
MLRYPQHVLQPEDLLTFILMDGFSDDWDELGLEDMDLQALEIMIMAAPTGPPVVPGTGRLRKIRFARSGRNVGKSGGARVCYVYFEEWKIVLLVVAYGKSEKDDLDPDEKRAIRALIQREEVAFLSRKGRSQR